MSQVLATYESSRGHGLQYNVIRGDDGVTYCNCTGWKMKKNCKHLLDFTVNNAKNAVNVTGVEEIVSNEERKETVKHLDGDQKVADAVQIAINMMKG